jgi:regulatory protein
MNETKKLNIYTIQQGLEKMAKYCAYQERCHEEVRQKLYNSYLNPDEIEEVIIQLIEQKYLNEARFAEAYTGGKFRLKGWGKRKIKASLEQKKISKNCIKAALESIPDDAYVDQLLKWIEKKWLSEKPAPYFAKKQKTIQFLMNKGFEYDLIAPLLPKE